MSTTRPSPNSQRLSSQDDCGLWMKADLNTAMDGPENAPQRRDDDAPLNSGERVDTKFLPSAPAAITHFYGVIDDDDVFMPPPPLPPCVASSLSREGDDFFMPPPPPLPSLPCTVSSLPTDGDEVFMPPPSPASCAAFSDRAQCIVPLSEDDVDPTPVTKAVDILTETGLTSLSLEDSSGRTEVVDVESKKDGSEDIVAENNERDSTWEFMDSDVETDPHLTQTPSSTDASPSKGICCDMLQTGEIRKTESTAECQAISFLMEDNNSTQPKPELDDRNAEEINTRTSLHESDSTVAKMLEKTGGLKNNKFKMETAATKSEVPEDAAGAMSNVKANIDSRDLNYDMAKEQWGRPDSDLPPPWPLISRGSSIEDSWTVATSILQGDQLLQRLLLVQKRQSEGQVWSLGVDAEVAKLAAEARRVERGTSGVEGMDCRHVTTEDEDQGQEGGETSRVENQDGGETELKRCEMRSTTKSTLPVPSADADISDDNQSDSRVPDELCPVKTQEIPLPQIHQCASSETFTERVLCQAVQGTQGRQRARVMLFEAFQQDNTEGPSRHRSRHPAGKDCTRPTALDRTHSLEAFSLKRNVGSRSQSFRLQRPEASERERNPESQKCKRPAGDNTRLSPYPQQDIPPRFHRSMDSLNLNASTSAVGDTEGREPGKKQELTLILKENPFFKLRPALALQPDVERDIRESREREEELRRQRCTLYGEMGRHRSEEEDSLTTSTLRAADDRLQSKGKLDRVWPPPSNKDQVNAGQRQEAKLHKPRVHKAAQWRPLEAGIVNGEQGTK